MSVVDTNFVSSGTGNANSINTTIDISGNDRAVAVTVAHRSSVDCSVTIGGVAATEILTVTPSWSTARRGRMFRLLNPSAGTGVAVVATLASGSVRMAMGVVSMDDVDQTTPERDTDTNTGGSEVTSASLTVTSDPGDICVSMLLGDNADNDAMVEGSGQTEHGAAQQSSNFLQSSHCHSAGDTGTKTHDWTIGGDGDFIAGVMASFQPAAGGGGVTVTPAAAEMAKVAASPAVVLGAITLTPSAAVQKTLATAPIVVHGPITVTPTVASHKTLAVSPSVVLGAITIAPSAAIMAKIAIDPTVDEGSGITVIPSAAAMVKIAASPVVVLGPISLVPALASTRKRAVSPSVLAGGQTRTLLVTKESIHNVDVLVLYLRSPSIQAYMPVVGDGTGGSVAPGYEIEVRALGNGAIDLLDSRGRYIVRVNPQSRLILIAVDDLYHPWRFVAATSAFSSRAYSEVS